MTIKTIPDTVRSDIAGVTPTAARYSIEDRRRAVTELDAAGESLEVHIVYGYLRDEIEANARGGASPQQTARALAFVDVYEERQRRRLRVRELAGAR